MVELQCFAGSGAAITAMSMVGKIFVTAAWQITTVWQGELFPTTHRVTLSTLTSIVGRVGIVIAPLLVDLVRTKVIIM